MLDSDCENGRSKAQETAAELYQLAALMLGDESQAAEAVEAAVAQTNIDPCADAKASAQAARIHLVEAAVARLTRANPRAFEVPAPSASAPHGCIEGEDLSSAGISASQLAAMVNGPGRRTLRDWLNKLSAVQRIIFVQRGILGWNNTVAAALLARFASDRFASGKPASGRWQPRQVGEVFRQALCSLANSLAHSAAAKA